MDQDFGVIEPSLPLFPPPTLTPPPPLFPLPTLITPPPLFSFLTSTPPPPSSFSQPPFQLAQAGRPRQNYRLPARYEDINPEPLRPLEEDEQPAAGRLLPRLCLIVRNRLRTTVNSFGLLCEYLYRPSFDPDSFVPEENLHRVSSSDSDHMPMPPLFPIPVHRNKSVKMLMNWKDSGASTKSDAEVNHLVKDVLLDRNFKLEDLQGFNVARENQQSNATEKKSLFFNSFQTADIDIEVPSGARGVPPGIFSVPGLLY
jgi:hypothetical protein